jgi:hypothetical protein
MSETNAEKLQRIKKETETLWKVSPNLQWLIEQVEKLDRCENLLSEAQDVLDNVHCYETEVFQEITRYFEGE